jgi:voltage-gated potassium channel
LTCRALFWFEDSCCIFCLDPLLSCALVQRQLSAYEVAMNMNRLAAKTMRRRFFMALRHAIHVVWPVLSAILGIQLALGLLIGVLEGWSLGDSVYFTFITGLTIGYGDLVPRQTLTRVLAIGVGFSGLFVTGLIAAIAVHAMRSALTDGGSGGERS